MAAGTAATARRPSSTAPTARQFRVLLFLVGTSIGGRRDRAADQAGDGDQGDDVRKRRDQVRRDVRLALQRDREREAESEQQGCRECEPRTPLSEDDGGKCDEAAA